jgi:hypothetical protein
MSYMPASSMAGIPMASAVRAAFCLVGLVLVFAMRPVFAATDDAPLAIEFVPPASPPQAGRAEGERWAIYLNGQIDEGAAERLREELARREIPSASVFLNSRGGVLGQGMELGRLIREHGFSTYVGRQNERGSNPLPGDCYSACVFAFIGGHYRFYAPRSRIGVHRFSAMSPADSDADAAQIVSAAIVNYILKMEVDVGLFDRMSRAGKDEMLVLPKTDLENLRVINNGRLPAEWAIESSNGATYLKGAQQSWLGVGEILLSCNEGQVVFHALFDAGDNAEAVRDSVKQHLIRFGDGYVPLADPRQPISIQDGHVSAEFVLSREQVNRLQASSSVGYAARLGYPNVFAGFSVDTVGPATEKISGFLKGCER